MAKKSKIVREQKLIRNVQKYASLRSELKNIIKSPNSSFEDKEAAVAKLDKLPSHLVVFALEIDVLKREGLEG